LSRSWCRRIAVSRRRADHLARRGTAPPTVGLLDDLLALFEVAEVWAVGGASWRPRFFDHSRTAMVAIAGPSSPGSSGRVK
jgi:hypothetical protein